MVPIAPISIGTMEIFKFYNFRVHVKLLGNFNPVVCENSKVNYFEFSCFIYLQY